MRGPACTAALLLSLGCDWCLLFMWGMVVGKICGAGGRAGGRWRRWRRCCRGRCATVALVACPLLPHDALHQRFLHVLVLVVAWVPRSGATRRTIVCECLPSGVRRLRGDGRPEFGPPLAVIIKP